MSKEMFKPENLSIAQMFGNENAYYQMPIYQRPYAWGEDHVKQLWDDLLDAFLSNQQDPEADANYFLGSVVVVDTGNNVSEVIDGQQRLTTLSILFCVIRDMQLAINDANIRRVLNSIKSHIDEKPRVKITTLLQNQLLFEDKVLNKVDFDADNRTINNNRFLQNALIFKDLISDAFKHDNKLNDDNINDFIDYIFNQTTMIKVTCFNESFAIKLFSILNDRGMNLSPVDIIKALMLQMLDEELHRQQFMEIWKKIEEMSHLKGKMLNLFSLYFFFRENKQIKKALQDEYKIILKEADPAREIIRIYEFAHILDDIHDMHDNKYISMLRYTPFGDYWKAVLTTALLKYYPNIDELLVLLTKYYYQSWISGGTNNRIKQTSLEIIKLLKDKKEITEIHKVIKDNLTKYENYKNYLTAENIRWKNWVKPVLLSIEYFMVDNKKYEEIRNDIHLEHILPECWSDERLNWKDYFTEEEANKYLNSLGNLTLLSGKKNSKASNKNFLDKKKIYDRNGYDGKTSFEVTKLLLENNEWTPAKIEERREWLLKEIYNIFDF